MALPWDSTHRKEEGQRLRPREVSEMRNYQIPDFSVVAFTGAAWLLGLAIMLLVQTPVSGFETSLFARTVLSAFAACGSIYLVKLGFDLRSTSESSQAAVREVIRRIDQTRKAA